MMRVRPTSNNAARQRFVKNYNACKLYGNDQYVVKALKMYESKTLIDKQLLIVFMAEQCDLFDYVVKQRQCVKSTRAYRHMVDHLLGALDYIHETCKVYHGDIKMENIVVSRSNDDSVAFKFIDFENCRLHAAFSRVLGHVAYGTIGMGNDERAMDEKFAIIMPLSWELGKQDVIALGKTFIDVYFGTPHVYYWDGAADGAADSAAAAAVHNTDYTLLLTLLSDISNIELQVILLRQMTALNPNDRPWAREIMQRASCINFT